MYIYIHMYKNEGIHDLHGCSWLSMVVLINHGCQWLSMVAALDISRDSTQILLIPLALIIPWCLKVASEIEAVPNNGTSSVKSVVFTSQSPDLWDGSG